jgi:hypothetical protein
MPTATAISIGSAQIHPTVYLSCSFLKLRSASARAVLVDEGFVLWNQRKMSDYFYINGIGKDLLKIEAPVNVLIAYLVRDSFSIREMGHSRSIVFNICRGQCDQMYAHCCRATSPYQAEDVRIQGVRSLRRLYSAQLKSSWSDA